MTGARWGRRRRNAKVLVGKQIIGLLGNCGDDDEVAASGDRSLPSC